MNVRAVQLRAVVVPLGVAILSVAALAWFALVRIPAQQHYLNERNQRLLGTLSGQIRSKVDNFDTAIDHALESFKRHDKGFTGLREYVHLFAPGLQIQRVSAEEPPKSDNQTLEEMLFKNAGDPPLVAIQRDEGKTYLYLGSKSDLGRGHGSVRVVARTDMDALVSMYLTPGRGLDALLLVAKDGWVIAQQSSAGLSLVRIDQFETLRASSDVPVVTIGGASYRLYVQPVQLSLIGVGKSEATGKPAVGTGEPEEWALCGLVTVDHFRAESSAFSYVSLLWFSAALVTLCLAIPLVKLRFLSPRERLRASDGSWVAAATFLGAGLLTFAVMDVYFFRFEFNRIADDRLRAVADKLRASLSDEVVAIDRQMKEFDSQTFWRDALHLNRSDVLRNSTGDPPKILFKPDASSEEQQPLCEPHWACKSALLDALGQERLKTISYPYFESAFWIGRDGSQRIKWSSSRGVTPFINIREEKTYYQDLQRAWRGKEQSDVVPRSGVAVFQSPNTGDRISVFWRSADPPLPGTHFGDWGQSLLVNSPVSLDQPMLPQYIQFAVIDSSGRVMFHSDHTRGLQENFFKECEDNLDLRSSVAGNHRALLTAYYLGRPHRLYATPLDLRPFADPRWSLIVFQDTGVAQTLNLETLTVAVGMFAVLAGILAAVWLVLYVLSPRGRMKWFWPDLSKGSQYRAVALLNAALGLTFVTIGSRLEGTALIVTAAIVTIVALAGTHMIVVGACGSSVGFDGLREFWRARAAFLFTVAAVPAMACFQVAYDFEMRLLVKSDQAHADMSRDERARHIADSVFDRFPRDKHADLHAFVTRRATSGWDVHWVPLIPAGRPAAVESGGSSRLETFLSLLHRPYNDVAVDLKAALIQVPAAVPVPRAAPTGWYWMIAGGLLTVFYAFLRRMVRPLFALDACTHPTLNPAEGVREPTLPVLLVGPPGSGKSTRLTSDPAIRVFDIRTQAFVERRKRARPVAVERRESVAVGAAAGAGAVNGISWAMGRDPLEPTSEPPLTSITSGPWAETFDYSTLSTDHSTVIGIDHLDYRLDEPEFRQQTLTFLEELTYRRKRAIVIAADRDPLTCVDESHPIDANQASFERGRWAQVLRSFRRENVGLGDATVFPRIAALPTRAPDRLSSASPAETALLKECSVAPQLVTIAKELLPRMRLIESLTEEDAKREFGVAAQPYYRALWWSCSSDHKLVLRQLAEEGLVNPRSQALVRDLIRAGLIVRDANLRIVNETFRRFVLQATTADQVAAWEAVGVQVPWASIETAMITVVIGLAVLLVLTQEQLLSAWTGFVPTLAPAVPTVLKLLARVQHGVKSDALA